MEGLSPRPSRLLRDKLTHPAAPPRARCALTGARSPRASDAGSRRRRRLRLSTSAAGRAGASGRAAAGDGERASREPQRTCAVEHAPPRPPLRAPRFPARPRALEWLTDLSRGALARGQSFRGNRAARCLSSLALVRLLESAPAPRPRP